MRPSIILFGAFDRHNFGDLLFPHVAAAMLPDADLRFAGLATRDLRAYGGHSVLALTDIAATRAGRAAGTRGSTASGGSEESGLVAQPDVLIHAGGELLTCEAWEAAVMLQSADGLQSTLAYLESRPKERRDWVRSVVATDERAPYVASRARLTPSTRVIHLGVGGVALDTVAPAMRAEVNAKLAAADAVSVRDRVTQAHLAATGIGASLIPDPAVLVAELFGDRIRTRARGPGEPGRVVGAFAHGYLALQFCAGFGDDPTLDVIAAQLDRVAADTGLGVVFFRAGIAPWHDDLDIYRRTVARMRTRATRVFESPDLWDICAVIASSRGFCGSSLHGRIVATAFGLPRVSLSPLEDPSAPSKQAAFVQAWEHADMPGVAGVRALAHGMLRALATDPAPRLATAAHLAAEFREGFARTVPRADMRRP